MALINCPGCRREISDMAKSCPHCGYKNDEVQEDSLYSEIEGNKVGFAYANIRKWLMTILSAIIVCVFLIILITNSGKYEGTYYKCECGDYDDNYTDLPMTFVFDADGTGRYYCENSVVHFTYEASNGGYVKMDAGKYVGYDGALSDGTYYLNDYGLSYCKRK